MFTILIYKNIISGNVIIMKIKFSIDFIKIKKLILEIKSEEMQELKYRTVCLKYRSK